MTLEEFEKMAKDIEAKADFIVSWKAIKYQKTIFRIATWANQVAEPGNRMEKNTCVFGMLWLRDIQHALNPW